MIGLLLLLLALLFHGPTPTPHGGTAAPTPAAMAPPAARGADRGPSGTSRAGRLSDGAAIPLPRPLAAPVTVAAPVPVPDADSPVCGPEQSPAADGCAQGQLPEETLGRAYG